MASASPKQIKIGLLIAGCVGVGLLGFALLKPYPPSRLLQVTLESYAENPEQDPFWARFPGLPARLTGVTPAEAREAFKQCDAPRWTDLGEPPKPFSDSTSVYRWSCQQGDVVIRANAAWAESYDGIDGVHFAACRVPVCPSFDESFEVDRSKIAIPGLNP